MADRVETLISLIAYTSNGSDELAQPITTRVETPVLATRVSISRSEFFSAGQKGIQPEVEFIVNPIEYEGQEEVMDGDTKYSVYRTYQPSADELELYCQLAPGLNKTEEEEP